MSELFELQEKFQDHLLSADEKFSQDIVSTTTTPADIRLAIYSNAYRSRLVDALAISYPVLKSFLGCEEYESLAHLYIAAKPSSFQSLRWFGGELAEFLSTSSDYRQFPYLAELAKIEWSMTLVFDAANSYVVKLAEMTDIPPTAWATMTLQAHPSVYLVNLSWNVVQIWQTITRDQTLIDPIKTETPVSWVFWRKDVTNHFCSLTEDEGWAVSALLNGLTFGEICAGLCQWVDESAAPLRAASLLKGWIDAGLIAKITFERVEHPENH